MGVFVGPFDGCPVGVDEGYFEGISVGYLVGPDVGFELGMSDGIDVGANVGDTVGTNFIFVTNMHITTVLKYGCNNMCTQIRDYFLCPYLLSMLLEAMIPFL